VFGWDDTQDFEGGQYTTFKVGDKVVAGGMDMGGFTDPQGAAFSIIDPSTIGS
jgi:hypothetical protein